MIGDNDADAAERRQLASLAYRMLGTVADAEDAVQETYLRWYRLPASERDAVANRAAWLTRAAGRVCLDALGTARARRERYVGEWLPEPLPAFAGGGASGAVRAANGSGDPLEEAALDESVSTALLVVLEMMTPAERVVFVLHDVFAVPFADIAEVVGRSAAAVRQLAVSARRRVSEDRRGEVSPRQHAEVARAFGAAARGGDIATLMTLLDPDVVVRSDSGGFVSAARHPVRGASNVARFLLGVLRKNPGAVVEERLTADGLGYVTVVSGRVTGVATLAVRAGRIVDVWMVLNPEKLTSWN
ncbi:RNA polymerase subunit sigma-24 [Subtercola boreus]|uniref:RNA polymerase subunit sigma-24 n=1 Tax=Subtercola boreus TaxID=120213 RepID=A0A3E0VE72_9MICO|nr:RNA polymerase sigma factor SigJ [Subtercola boreus]RFA07853.1 RNA polymerase subunit sigma-24 [Subtercola boreus]TQL55296.1 RNA polymerase sigma-70 factor (ECF subfamily) [Subtercola boreus]